MMRVALYEAAFVALTRSQGRWNPLKAWGVAIAKRRGIQKAIVAVARKLGISLHRMWRDGTGSRTTPAKVYRRFAHVPIIELLHAGGGPCGDDGSGRDRGNSSARQP